MRSHAEMRELARDVLASFEPPSASERQLAKDVIDLLDELDGPAPHVVYKESRDIQDEALIMASMIVTAVPVLIVGKYISWWLALGLWEVVATGYFLTDLRKWRGEGWRRLLGVPVAAIYGPILLATDVLRARLPARLLSQRDA